MAIFHGRDVRLPLLTQLYQVDEKDIDELDELARRVEGAAEIPELAELVAPDRVIIPGERDWNYGEIQSTLKQIRPVMDALADDALITTHHLYKLVESMMVTQMIEPFVVKETRGAALVLSTLPVGNADSDDPSEVFPEVPMRSVRFFAADINPLAAKALLAMQTALLDRSVFQRCADCHNPFQVSQPDRNNAQQTYCSRRCAARVGTRRRRAQAIKG